MKKIDELVLEGKIDDPELWNQIDKLTSSLTRKKYSQDIFRNQDFLESYLTAGRVGTKIAYDRYDPEKGGYTTFARHYILGEVYEV